MTFVLDTSVAMAWCFEDEADDFADQILDRLRDSDAVVPGLWRLEVANVLLVAERQRRITEAQATRFVELVQRLPIRTEIDVLEVSDVLAAGRRHGLSAYDACYLLLAERRGVPLATLDSTLAVAGRSAGVTVWSAD
jgi:predicted nucleic acid-binding protein